MEKVFCFVCGKEFVVKPGRISWHNYCSNECMYIGRRELSNARLGKITGEDIEGWLQREYIENQRSVRNIAEEIYGTKKSSSSVLRLLKRYGIETRKGGDAVKTQWLNNDERRKNAADGMKKRITPDVRKKINRAMLTEDYREKQRVSKTGERNGMYGIIGENNPHWNPERTHEQRVKERKTNMDREWRIAVFERDQYQCQACGDDRGGNLTAHHIQSYHLHKETRYDINNGVTLCGLCHKEYHSIYGWKSASRKKFESFMQVKKQKTA